MPTRAGDRGFWIIIGSIAGAYLLLILALLVADGVWLAEERRIGLLALLHEPYIASSIRLTLITCTAAAIISLLLAVPCGYLISRTQFRGKALVDALIDIPFVLPPLVIGLSLLVLFRLPLPGGGTLQDATGLPFTVGAVILAQVTVAAAFAVRAMRSTFDHLPTRPEQVARVLGCSQADAFARVTLPMARRGMVTAFTIAWARSMGEFGPILVFAGMTRGRTEVMSSTVFLELSVGNLDAAIWVSALMVAISIAVLVVVRVFGDGHGRIHDRG